MKRYAAFPDSLDGHNEGNSGKGVQRGVKRGKQGKADIPRQIYLNLAHQDHQTENGNGNNPDQDGQLLG
jgi:hypothetical protein